MRASYDHRPSEVPFLGQTIGQCLEDRAHAMGDREALVSRHESSRLTYAGLYAQAQQVARGLLSLGVQKGDRVSIWSTNNQAWVVVQHATALIGAVLVNVNPAFRLHELEYVMRASRTRVLLLGEGFRDAVYPELLYELCPEIRDSRPGDLSCADLPHLKAVVYLGGDAVSAAATGGGAGNGAGAGGGAAARTAATAARPAPRPPSTPAATSPGMLTFEELGARGDRVDPQELTRRSEDLDPDDDINIQYTSGTTGLPKGVTLSHHNILNNAFFVGRTMRLTPDDRLCVAVPFYHCFGMVLGTLACLASGACLVIPAPWFDPGEVLAAVEEERCTALHGVPTMFIAELAHPDFARFDLSTLRTGIMAGAPCPIDVVHDVMDRMHMREVLIGYGQTEVSPIATLTQPDDPPEKRAETVGRTTAHQELKIVDPATGKTVDRGVTGEVCFRGYHLMARYDNDPTATAETVDVHGWLHSGDLGTMDDEGYIKIVGRIKEMVIRGGENIYPREIEEFLHTLDMVLDAYVIGVPDLKYGEELMAWVSLREGVEPPTADEFRALCRGKIATFKIPHYWKVVDQFPMTVTGKVQKFRMREVAIEELGLQAAAGVRTA